MLRHFILLRSMPALKTVRSENDVRDECNVKIKTHRRISSVSLSPRFQRRIQMVKSRTPSSDSFAQALATLHARNEQRSRYDFT